MDKTITGIHHVTAIAGDPQQNVDFYAGLLGLRLVKLTVNFDDPTTYHLYYGDGVGTPGTILTFFPWPGAHRGRRGNGQVTSVAFSVPPGSLPYWEDRLQSAGLRPERQERFGDEVLSFDDPDGLGLELVQSDDDRPGRPEGPLPAEYAIRGFYNVTMSEAGLERTLALMHGGMGFEAVEQNGDRSRFRVGKGGPGALVDLVHRPGEKLGTVAVGSVHHVAWRVADESEQASWREHLARLGYNVTPIIDRQYFHSIYFREPGGVLFEIATDPPGFTVDEPLESLGTHLKLPPQYERLRPQLETILPKLVLPESTSAAL